MPTTTTSKSTYCLYNKSNSWYNTTMITLKYILSGILALVAFVALCIVNQAYGTSEPVGEVYKYSYSYCGGYAGSGGTRHCTLWLPAHEYRQNVRVHGVFFDTDSYKVVSK